MNRNIIYIALLSAAAALSACVKERPPVPQPDNLPKAVGLSVDDAQTRGDVTSSADQILSLGIFGYSTGTEDFNASNPLHTPNLFADREATRENVASVLTPWTYDPVALWPSDLNEKNTFFAYSPYQPEFPTDSDGEFVVSAASPGYPRISYRVPSMVSEQVDLLYSEFNADVKNINYNTNTVHPGHVKYNMKHAMLWIRFIITTVDETGGSNPYPETYTIKEFSFTGGNIITAGTFDMGTAAWSADPAFSGDADGYEAATYEFDHLEGAPLIIPAGQTVPLTGATECLMMIPQNIVQATNLTTVYVLYTHNDGSGSPKTTELYKTIPFPDVQLGHAGTVMTYIVKVSTSGAWITFRDDNTIEKWLQDPTDRPIETF